MLSRRRRILVTSAATLSGGESQRIRLATQIGSGLMGVLYVCDEPSIGLHPVDNDRLIETLTKLRNLGNTVLGVEHDEAMIRAGDYIIDMGPGGGEAGGGPSYADQRLLRWMDAEKVDGFVKWTPFKHPTLGDVEIGGGSLPAVRIELLPFALGVIEETLSPYEPVPFGLRAEDFTDFALAQYQARVARIDRARGRALGRETPVGWMPRYEHLDWTGLDFPEDRFDRITSIDRDAWRQEFKLHDELFAMLAQHLPVELLRIRKSLEERLVA